MYRNRKDTFFLNRVIVKQKSIYTVFTLINTDKIVSYDYSQVLQAMSHRPIDKSSGLFKQVNLENEQSEAPGRDPAAGPHCNRMIYK